MFNNCELQAKCLRDQVFTHSCCHSSCSAVFFWCRHGSAHLRYPTVVKWPEEKTSLFLSCSFSLHKWKITKQKQNKTKTQKTVLHFPSLVWLIFLQEGGGSMSLFPQATQAPPLPLWAEALSGLSPGQTRSPPADMAALGLLESITWFAPTRQPQSPRLLLTGHSLWPFLALPLFK